MNNADRIRKQMTDGELAEWCANQFAQCPNGHFFGDYDCDKCSNYWLDWLKEGGEDDSIKKWQ